MSNFFEIETLPVIAKYIRGRARDGVVSASLGDELGAELYMLAQVEKYQIYMGNNRKALELNGRVRVLVSEFHPTRKMKLFNYVELCIITEYWRWHMVNEFLGLVKKGFSPRLAISTFRSKYDLQDEDWEENTMWQIYTRHRQGKCEYSYKPHYMIRVPDFQQ